ncbi:MAG TPA: NAD(P)/FAD-dependent oxidoreductase [Polyangiaceae bacterium]|nr:NAD(P)/FAD-dependent oxidoreductase [Polyangiaceae bacterium]
MHVAIIGAGIAGMATALRLQARGVKTTLFEAHGQPGGCAGFFRRRGFSFDVGATTLVDFEAGGVGGELLESVGLGPIEGEPLPGYVAWLPDRRVVLHRDQAAWGRERLRAFGDDAAHRAFWALLDRLADVFWRASRAGVCLPLRGAADLARAASLLSPRDWPLARHLGRTMGDALRAAGLAGDRALRGLLGMLIEDTVHSSVERAPLINAALGVTIRGAGLTRAAGGMRGFFRALAARYRALGGALRVGCRVDRVEGREGAFTLVTQRGRFEADQIVSGLPAELSAAVGPPGVAEALAPHLAHNRGAEGGALVVFLGVPEREIAGQGFTHHQLLHDYEAPLGSGNNMFLSLSAPGDTESAPEGYRALMISTHCELGPWQGLAPADYAAARDAAGARLVELARRVYPELAARPLVYEVATPRTYERFTRRPRGAVGGFRLGLDNANQRAIPHDVGVPGFWLVGDTTWPGLGTVACVLGSRAVADRVCARARRALPAAGARLRREAPRGA